MIYVLLRPRFGLFSHPTSTAIGDNYPHKIVPTRKKDDPVETQPKKIYTTGLKKGHDDSVLFAKPSYYEKMTFIEAGMNQMRSHDKEGYLKAGHDRRFKLARATHEKLHKTPYEWIPPSSKSPGIKNYRNEEGQVQVGPRNIFTTPMKKGQIGPKVYFAEKLYEYKEGDKYDI